MRPPEFTGGNVCAANHRSSSSGVSFNEAAGIHRRKPSGAHWRQNAAPSCFNEAAGIHRRKLTRRGIDAVRAATASMRPPEFTGGNISSSIAPHATNVHCCFNEAAGIHRRKRGTGRRRHAAPEQEMLQ